VRAIAVDVAHADGRTKIALRVALLHVAEVGENGDGQLLSYTSRAAIQGDRKDRRAVTHRGRQKRVTRMDSDPSVRKLQSKILLMDA
jgi:hypothetical protein